MRRSIPPERLAALPAGRDGLSDTRAGELRARYGDNDIVESSAPGWPALLRETARDPMLWFLLATAALFGGLGDIAEAVTLVVAMVPLVGMDLFLHRRTQASTQGLRGRLANTAEVLRDGRWQTLPAPQLVPGDLVRVGAGDALPADGLVVSGDDVQIDESALTGEAYPVRKRPGGTPGEGDEDRWAFAGTRLLTAQAEVRVVFTGAETLYGEIVRSATRGRRARTPLQLAIANLVTILVVAAAIMCLLLAWVRLQQGFGIVDALLSAVTLAVAALPEEFPVVFTFFLGVGVFRLARRQALVRRAVVVENIGRVTCICSDKTGTITAGELQVAHDYPAGGLTRADLLGVAALASRAESGDPLDRAILAAAAAKPDNAASPLETFPFTEDRKRESVVARLADGTLVAAVKGAPEVILAMTTLPDKERSEWQRRVAALAADGHKVIACARRVLDEATWPGGEPDRGLELAGLLACEDPVREGVREAVHACREVGIKVLMVTGDHPVTARAVARELGLGEGPGSGSAREPGVLEADALLAPDTGTGQAAQVDWSEVDVVARAVPAQKLDLVRALQSRGEIVAVTGDGVNDVPALQAADVGVAMGERGTRSAREAAAIVLLDDNFRTIVRAIAEGRQLFRNLQLSFAYLLMVHIPLVLTAALVPLMGYPLLYLPIHIVWLELIIHPTALLVFQQLAPGGGLQAQHRPPAGAARPRFFNRRQWLVIGSVGALVTLVVTLGYERSLGSTQHVEHARAMALVALTIASATVTAGLSGLRTRGAWVMVTITLALSALLVQTPWLAGRLHLSPLHWDDWLGAAGGGLLAAVVSTFLRSGAERRSAP